MKTNRKVLSILLAVVMLLSAIPFTAFAAGNKPEISDEWSCTADGVYYVVDKDGNATIKTTVDDLTGAVEIPAAVDGYPVVAIGDYAYFGMSKITSVVIPDSVVTIGNGAFYMCYALEEVTIGANVAVIGNGSFCDCNVKSVSIPKSVTTIGNRAFEGCFFLTDVTYEGTQEDWDKIEIGTSALPNGVSVEVHVHDYACKVTKAANCIEEGENVYTCEGCGDTYTEVVAKTAHAYVIDKAVPATCTRYGITEGKHCEVCGLVSVEQKILTPLKFVDEDNNGKCDNCGLSRFRHLIRWYYAIMLHILEVIFSSLIEAFGPSNAYVRLLTRVHELQADLG